MGQPALQLLPAETATAEAAAKQATRLILIEGGKNAALATGEAAASEGLLSALGRSAVGGVLGTAAAPVIAFLTVLFWPTTLGDGTLKQPPSNQASSATTPAAVPQSNLEPVQKCPERKGCPPHDWEVKTPGKSVEEAVRDFDKRIAGLRNSPSQAGEMRGVQFERDAMILNNKKHPIEAVGTEYVCRRCGKEQEVDIIFKDGQIAESKSANFKQVSKSKQPRKLADLQSFFNCNKGTSFKPLAKLDDNHPDVDRVAQKFHDRGFELERLNTHSMR